MCTARLLVLLFLLAVVVAAVNVVNAVVTLFHRVRLPVSIISC